MLTRTETVALEFIAGYIQDSGGIAPSYNEIMRVIGHRSKSKIGFILEDLERKGKIRRLANRARAIEIVDPQAPKPRKPVAVFPRAVFFKFDDEAKELVEWEP